MENKNKLNSCDNFIIDHETRPKNKPNFERNKRYRFFVVKENQNK